MKNSQIELEYKLPQNKLDIYGYSKDLQGQTIEILIELLGETYQVPGKALHTSGLQYEHLKHRKILFRRKIEITESLMTVALPSEISKYYDYKSDYMTMNVRGQVLLEEQILVEAPLQTLLTESLNQHPRQPSFNGEFLADLQVDDVSSISNFLASPTKYQMRFFYGWLFLVVTYFLSWLVIMLFFTDNIPSDLFYDLLEGDDEGGLLGVFVVYVILGPFGIGAAWRWLKPELVSIVQWETTVPERVFDSNELLISDLLKGHATQKLRNITLQVVAHNFETMYFKTKSVTVVEDQEDVEDEDNWDEYNNYYGDYEVKERNSSEKVSVIARSVQLCREPIEFIPRGANLEDYLNQPIDLSLLFATLYPPQSISGGFEVSVQLEINIIEPYLPDAQIFVDSLQFNPLRFISSNFSRT